MTGRRQSAEVFRHAARIHAEPPPLLGEHTAEVLRDVLGMDDAEIERLTKQGVVTR